MEIHALLSMGESDGSIDSFISFIEQAKAQGATNYQLSYRKDILYGETFLRFYRRYKPRPQDYIEESENNNFLLKETGLCSYVSLSIEDVMQSLRNIFEQTGEFKPSPGQIKTELLKIVNEKFANSH